MWRRALRIFGIGLVLIAGSLYLFEWIASDFVTPHIGPAKWAILALAVIVAVSMRNRDDVVQHHLPH
jgi:hypothetical protein